MALSKISARMITGAITAALEYTANMAGAIKRAVLSKLSERVSVKDFGAKGDWVPAGAGAGAGTDDTAAFEAAIAAVRAANMALFIPAGNYRITRKLDCTGITMYGDGRTVSMLYFSADQLDVIGTAGDTYMRSFGIDGGWDGNSPNKGGHAISATAAAGAYPYNVHLDNVRIINAKANGVYIERGGYSSIFRCKINACGLHAVELKGTGPGNYVTTVHISGMTVMSDTPYGFGLMLTNAQHISVDGAISEYTAGCHTSGVDNRAISLRSYYQEFTRGGVYLSNDGSGIGLTIAGCFGGGHVVQDLPTWYNVYFHGNSNMTECAPFNGRVVTSTGNEATTTVTTGLDVTLASIVLTPGTWLVFGTMQTVNASSGIVTEAACQITTDNTLSGRNIATSPSGFNIGAEAITLNPGVNANLRPQVFKVHQNLTTANQTLYLRGYMKLTSGTLAYKGAITAVKL